VGHRFSCFSCYRLVSLANPPSLLCRPPGQHPVDSLPHQRPGARPLHALHQKRIVVGVLVTNVSHNRKIDCRTVECAAGGGATHATG
jgi:hypothetical protein